MTTYESTFKKLQLAALETLLDYAVALMEFNSETIRQIFERSHMISGYTPRPVCPACRHALSMDAVARPFQKVAGVFECDQCAAIFGKVLPGAGVYLVHEKWLADANEDTETRYFDLTTVSDGEVVSRRHGWYNPATRRIVQTG